MCKDCMHYDVCAECICTHYIDVTKCENYISYADVQEALEKQKPKKLNDSRIIAISIKVGVCPICNEGCNDDMRYCDKCGQSLDWSDEK